MSEEGQLQTQKWIEIHGTFFVQKLIPYNHQEPDQVMHTWMVLRVVVSLVLAWPGMFYQYHKDSYQMLAVEQK